MKKDFERQVHTWMMKKIKKVIVYKTKEGEKKGDWKIILKSQHEGMSEDTLGINCTYSSSLMTLKSNILAQDSD